MVARCRRCSVEDGPVCSECEEVEELAKVLLYSSSPPPSLDAMRDAIEGTEEGSVAHKLMQRSLYNELTLRRAFRLDASRYSNRPKAPESEGEHGEETGVG